MKSRYVDISIILHSIRKSVDNRKDRSWKQKKSLCLESSGSNKTVPGTERWPTKISRYLSVIGKLPNGSLRCLLSLLKMVLAFFLFGSAAETWHTKRKDSNASLITLYYFSIGFAVSIWMIKPGYLYKSTIQGRFWRFFWYSAYSTFCWLLSDFELIH